MTTSEPSGEMPSSDRPKGCGASSPGQKNADVPPTWASGHEALAVCLHRPNRRRIALIAAVVGTFLVGINQGSILLSGHAGWVVWIRVLLDYLTPACVSTMGVLAGSRRAATTNGP